MKSSSILSTLCIVPLLAGAAPAGRIHVRDASITAEQIKTIAPTSSSCDNPPAVGECATAAQAAPNIAKSFDTYSVTSRAEQAAVIGLMAFESGDFKYNKNHFPGVPGQGTRNMQSPTYNSKYAADIPALADKLSSVSGDPTGVLDLLLANEEYDFGSGAWFLTTQCSASVRSQLQSGSEAGWTAYITSCVGTDANDDRKAYWTRAIQALGVSS
ncbi:hypothetical protein BO94DRAFT_259984 [Aspergillus sclerotioniger CBS 115572]|uniref:Lysozyme-like protein n=1 Tax=Aspergillus sclerotioniger CBS 115572 TaxID=1450535 RepID=A0A317VDP7_9EURO|nr:hypothetical protein BO94DRAFT_259984 [Aspergillus sclerotioniger CBS 115572]PWY71559.1 hypothetical protein BO94DRAFT_259984 [Aspergillus sclerotioniger CBS 115572]